MGQNRGKTADLFGNMPLFPPYHFGEEDSTVLASL